MSDDDSSEKSSVKLQRNLPEPEKEFDINDQALLALLGRIILQEETMMWLKQRWVFASCEWAEGQVQEIVAMDKEEFSIDDISNGLQLKSWCNHEVVGGPWEPSYHNHFCDPLLLEKHAMKKFILWV